MPKTLLFVDDEKQILNSLRRVFNGTGYKLLFAESGTAALEILSHESVDLIISDMRMPEMNGYDFLKQVRKTYPEIIRIILSGYAEKSTILKAVSDGIAKSYMVKPWDNEQLVNKISHLFAVYGHIGNKNIRKGISDITELPVLPEIYYKVTEMISDDRSNGEISNVISQDPGLTTNILKIANSAFYGGNIGSIKKALTFLGSIAVKNIILSSELFEYFKDNQNKLWNTKELLLHSNLCNRYFHGIYHYKYAEAMPEDCSAAGLLHDLGKLLVIRYYPSEFELLMNNPDFGRSISTEKEEKAAMGVTHSELGAWLLDWWNLPMSLVEIILFHHDPLNDGVLNKELTAILHLADYFSMKEAGNNPEFEIDDGVYVSAGIGKEDVAGVIAELSDSEQGMSK